MIKPGFSSTCKTGVALLMLGLVLQWNAEAFGLEKTAAGSKLAQDITVTGKVTDLKGDALPGVSVIVKGTKNGTTTNASGQYTLKQVPDNATLVLSFLGFKTREVAVNRRKAINVILEDDTKALDEVVVVGYGTVKKSHLTGSITKLENQNLDEIPASRLDNALVGKLAGVNIQNVNPEAGATPQIRVRGLNSISADSEPLVVVDGYPVPDGLAFVNSQDVASIEVLKDAASAAIYGSRGANGVILITTKSGRSDKPRYSIKAYTGIKEAYKLNPHMTFTDYAQMLYNEAALRANDPTVPANRRNLISAGEQASYIIESQISGSPTDWQQEGLRDASINNVQFNISGGKKDLRYYISSSIQRDQGIMKESQNDKLNFNAKIDGSLSKKVTFGLNLNPSYNKINRPPVNYTDYYRYASFIPVFHNEFTAAFVNQNPQWANIKAGDYAQPRHFSDLSYAGLMPDGSYFTGSSVDPWSSTSNNPVTIMDREDRNTHTYRMLGGGNISVNFLPNLVFKTSIGGYFTYQENNSFIQTDSRNDGQVNEATFGTRKLVDYLWENTLNYSFKKKDHNFTGLLGYTAQKTTTFLSNINGYNFPNEDFQTINQAAQINQSLTNTTQEPIGLISYLGRITYDYKGKYLFSTSLRSDGSTYFNKGRQYGWFPSVSAGWRLKEESFLQQVNWLSDLKLRASYGATGNNRIQSFAYYNLLYPGNYSFGDGTGAVSPGLAPNSNTLSNRSITWERTYEYNIGFDAGFNKSKFTVALDYYNKVTDRLLFKETAMSFSGSYDHWNNVGRVRNQGIELDFSSLNFSKRNFEWKSSFNLSANRNKLLDLGGEQYQLNYGEREEVYAAYLGGPAIQYYGYKTDGVWLSQAQIDEAKTNGQTSTLSRYYQAGGLKFVDVNGDNVISIEDRTILGTPFPDFTWGLTNAFKYKSFDLNILLQGVQGAKVINGDANYNENKRYNPKFTENRWLSAANPGDGKTPYYTNGENWMLTDYVIEDASYAAIRNVIIGYTLPKKFAAKANLKGLRFYGSIDNLLYIMGKTYRGINPEALTTTNQYSSPLISGYQRGAFPIGRTFTFGVDLNL
ncbi:SusC/RagA family TonB-linked outer membrane protein [Desertivirga xinjiangensis]|uniref:SusC/RagA family TonB-linked outer membrane protein n=1 Tax=Desertivirga xinjiangensis TaxID=539206 RepID=UPI00210EE36F|nr:TonB-dependent receptor [Pedobacter xinjiangensis]